MIHIPTSSLFFAMGYDCVCVSTQGVFQDRVSRGRVQSSEGQILLGGKGRNVNSLFTFPISDLEVEELLLTQVRTNSFGIAY